MASFVLPTIGTMILIGFEGYHSCAVAGRNAPAKSKAPSAAAL